VITVTVQEDVMETRCGVRTANRLALAAANLLTE
jgi:hypothetical protein